MLYMIYSTDVQNSLEHRKAARPAHLARLQILKDEGRLLTAGPLPAIDSEDPQDSGFTGSLVIAQFNSLEDAREWAADDHMLPVAYMKTLLLNHLKKCSLLN